MPKYNANKDGTLREKAEHWLERAVVFEAEGKPERNVEMAFNAALKHENEAIAKGE